jgi:hypothetical protein
MDFTWSETIFVFVYLIFYILYCLDIYLYVYVYLYLYTIYIYLISIHIRQIEIYIYIYFYVSYIIPVVREDRQAEFLFFCPKSLRGFCPFRDCSSPQSSSTSFTSKPRSQNDPDTGAMLLRLFQTNCTWHSGKLRDLICFLFLFFLYFSVLFRTIAYVSFRLKEKVTVENS